MIDVGPYLNATAYFSRATGLTEAGGSTWSAPAALLVHDEQEPQLVRKGAQGTEGQHSSEVWTKTQLQVGDRLWLPGEDPATDSPRDVMGVRAIRDLDGQVLFWKAAF